MVARWKESPNCSLQLGSVQDRWQCSHSFYSSRCQVWHHQLALKTRKAMKRPLEWLGILIALAALVVALTTWLAPFKPVGPSPFTPRKSVTSVPAKTNRETEPPMPLPTSQEPTVFPTTSGGSPVIELSDLCSPISSCNCTWAFKPIESSFPSPNRDTFSLRNIGTGNLVLSRETSSCDGCLSGWHNPINGDVIGPNSHTQFFIEYYWDKDPQQGASHEHTITIHSSATNCPVLEIKVPISYK